MHPLNEKWMGIDFGLARIGIAVSDPLGILASGLVTIRWNGRDLSGVQERLLALIEQHQVDGIVLGCPNRTDGRLTGLVDQVHALAQTLERESGKPVRLRDERYTTVIARRMLQERGVREKRQRPVIDQVAAEIILQEHLDALRKSSC